MINAEAGRCGVAEEVVYPSPGYHVLLFLRIIFINKYFDSVMCIYKSLKYKSLWQHPEE